MKSLKFIFLVTGLFTALSAYSVENKLVFEQKIAANFSKLWYSVPQEKLYLHTDKPYYSAGEPIWFKGYLLNATTHLANTRSKYIYVELIDQADSVITRIKVKKDSTGFSGHINLKPELIAGTYVLRAYTYWMQNASPDFFFKKQIHIGNSIDDRMKCDFTCGTLNNGYLPVILKFTNTYGTPFVDKEFTIDMLWLKDNKRKFARKTDSSGKITISVPYNLTDSVKRMLGVSINETGLKYNNKFVLPQLSNDYDVAFLPESGVFLNDDLQTIAFKAIGRNGLGVDIQGEIYNNNNELITELKSDYKGMGRVSIKTNPGESYYALIKNSAGLAKRFILPTTSAKGISLQITHNKDKINYKIFNRSGNPDSEFSLMVHSRGWLCLVLPLSKLEGQISKAILPTGIVSFTVIDSTGNTYCERLVFVKPASAPLVQMQQDKPVYDKRSPVNLTFQVSDKNGSPLKGTFSISVTDSKLVTKDSVNDNLVSYLLLSSDIKGYIEEPARYFANDSLITRGKLDLLMCTQGWRRFNTGEIAKGKIKQPEFYLEMGQTVSGKVLNLLNKPAVGCDVVLLSSYRNQFSVNKTDSLGNFLIDRIEFPDSTSIILKAKSKSRIIDVELIPDKDIFPKWSNYFPVSNVYSQAPSEDYLITNKEKYYTDGGMLMINLDEFTVTGNLQKNSSEDNSFYSGMADTDISEADLEKMQGYSIFNILSTIPGVMVNGDQISIRGSTGSPLFVINGVETEDVEDINSLSSSDIQNVSVFKGANTALFGSKGGNGVIIIDLKEGVTRKFQSPPSMALITPLGFQKHAEFYVPKYDVDSIKMQNKSDLRTTIYWKPNISSADDGSFNIRFFTADRANNYNVELEGVGANGEICRFCTVLNRQN